MLSGECYAMTFSQPVKIGKIFFVNLPGFKFKQASHNDGVLSTSTRNVQKDIYDHGVARFGDGGEAVYFHYKYRTFIANKNGQNTISEGYTKFGSTDINNTVDIGILSPELLKVKTDTGITLYVLEDDYDVAEDHGYIVFGKRADGKFVKYFNTYEIREKYFGSRGCAIDKITFNSDTIVIPYSLRLNDEYKYVKKASFASSGTIKRNGLV